MRRWARVCVAVLAMSAGCAWQPVPYDPKASMTVEEATKVVERALREQPPGTSYGDVEVTPERAILMGSRAEANLWTGARGFVPVQTTIYFDSIGKADLSEKNRARNQFVVRVWYRGTEAVIKAFFSERTKAERFLDALHVLTTNATAGKADSAGTAPSATGSP